MRRPGSIPLHEHDPWPLRLVIFFLGATLLLSTASITWLLSDGHDVTGFFAVPVGITVSLPMLLSRRPPWTADAGRLPASTSREA